MNHCSSKLPAPSPEALAHSAELLQVIRTEITAHQGLLPFSRYMELALYAPGLGYYSAGSRKFGSGGDFVTAPELSPLFARCLALQCKQVLQTLEQGGAILEFGAGSGMMASDLLLELEQQQALPEHYFILEISADLRARQRELLSQRIPHLLSRIQWLDRLPTKPFAGVILANEVLDAMPVQRFQVNSAGIQEYYVSWQQDQLVWQLSEPSNSELQQQVAQLNIKLITDHYDSEINLLLPGWVTSIGHCLSAGLILLIDYGFPQHEYYHPDRSMGTLMCHYQHLAHTDPLIFPGLQDITAHVDFTAVAEAASANKLRVAGFTTQAAFLLGCGLLDLAGPQDDIRAQLAISQQIQKLTSPAEMGELFKVIALTRNLDNIRLRGLSLQDQRQRL